MKLSWVDIKNYDWDFIIEPKRFIELANRILEKKWSKWFVFVKRAIHYSIINKQYQMPFNYRAIWEKMTLQIAFVY